MTKTRQIRAMGTVIDLMLLGDISEALMDLCVFRLREYEHRFSANDPTSELMAINLNAGIQPVIVQPELFQLIKLGREHSLVEKSLLNIAIGPLVQTWRIGFDDARVPDKSEISHALSLQSPQNIVLNEERQTVYLTTPEMKLDLGSLAKGYIADLLVAELKRRGVRAGILNLGGNVLTFGASKREDTLWRIGIRDPNGDTNSMKRVLKLKDKSVVTSGIYERTLQIAGQRYHHIFDPATGYPMETDLASLTILSNDSVTGELWTTRLFGLPVEDILREVNAFSDIEALILLKDGTEFLSSGMSAYL